jgi:hypothetical protein
LYKYGSSSAFPDSLKFNNTSAALMLRGIASLVKLSAALSLGSKAIYSAWFMVNETLIYDTCTQNNENILVEVSKVL